MAEPFTPEQAINTGPAEKQPIPQDVKEKRKFTGFIDHLVDVELRNANALNREYGKDKELIRKQRLILHRLGPNIIEELQGHLQATHIEQWNQINEFTQLKGEVFERILEAEDELYDLFPETIQPSEESEEKHEIGELILALMQNPSRFGFEDFSSLSNPDLFSIRFEGDSYIIETSIEAKTHLDGRARHQLSDNGFRKAIKTILEKVNSLEDPSRHGLEGLGVKGRMIRLSDDYKQSLIVPRDLALTPDSIGRSQGKKHEISRQEAYEFSQELQEMESRGLLVRSCFSNVEIKQITSIFLKEINKRVAAQK